MNYYSRVPLVSFAMNFFFFKYYALLFTVCFLFYLFSVFSISDVSPLLNISDLFDPLNVIRIT